jgi:cellulose synthase/poly-beta-1,6-N-acetylglucosamine synthase-like glycosyltransferase
MPTQVIAQKNFGYPGDLQVREAIRDWHGSTGLKNVGKPFEGDRGEIVEVMEGDNILAPDDLLDAWLDTGLALIPLDPSGVNNG